MTTATLDAPTNLHQVIAELDLIAIEKRLSRKLKWDAERIAKAIGEYRQFLQFILIEGMCKGRRPLSPDMDEVWHAHILHTRQYATDCETIFGQFLHHQPLAESQHDAACACDGDCACGGGDCACE